MQITPHPDIPILTLNRTDETVVMLGEGGVTVERMDMMAEGVRGDKSPCCNGLASNSSYVLVG